MFCSVVSLIKLGILLEFDHKTKIQYCPRVIYDLFDSLKFVLITVKGSGGVLIYSFK